MDHTRPGMYPLYAAQMHNTLTSISPERFRFPGQPHFPFPVAMFPAMHPIAAHQHPHPHPHPGFAHPMATQAVLHGRGLPRMPQPAHVHTHAHTAVLHNVQMAPQLSITQEELDTVLYGYAKNRNGDQCQGHALSGLNLNQQAAISEKSPGTCESVTFGIDKILSASKPPGSSHSSKPSQSTIDATVLELPEGVALIQTIFAGVMHYGIFCTKTVIARGTRFGPFKGRIIHTSEIKTHDDNSNMWEIFQDGKLSHFIDGRGSSGNWMAHVKCARYAQEQNLIAVQADGAIWYEACKDIPQGTELLVWYGDCYLQFMGVPVALKEMADGGAQEEADTSEGYQCERCGKVFAYKYYRDKHLKYTRCVDQGDRKYPCTLCSRSFEKRDRLRIHILHVHEKHRPHKCMVCGKSFSQSSSLNKHMRVHSGERPYKCVYCNKAFTASSILRTHIRQHSGEKPFKCKHCGKAFASHAAHDSHVRRTHSKSYSMSAGSSMKYEVPPYKQMTV